MRLLSLQRYSTLEQANISVKIREKGCIRVFTNHKCISVIVRFVNCGAEYRTLINFCPMFTVFVTRTVGGSVLQKDFEELEGARAYFDRLLTEKPYDGVIVMLLKREGYSRNFLVDANVIPSPMKLVGKPTDTVDPDKVFDPRNR